jgi:hypothetical protein
MKKTGTRALAAQRLRKADVCSLEPVQIGGEQELHTPSGIAARHSSTVARWISATFESGVW